MSKYNFEQKRNDYMSPPELVKKALAVKNRQEFDLDVCCSDFNIPAIHYYTDGDCDGLKMRWKKLNWCNPPFDQCAKWIKKAYEEQQEGNETVILIPVRTETKDWHEYILFNPKVEIQWLRKGYSFINPDDKKSMGVFKKALALVYFNA
jgi:site-specific DNA-methyltransferase (adenine-specific)